MTGGRALSIRSQSGAITVSGQWGCIRSRARPMIRSDRMRRRLLIHTPARIARLAAASIRRVICCMRRRTLGGMRTRSGHRMCGSSDCSRECITRQGRRLRSTLRGGTLLSRSTLERLVRTTQQQTLNGWMRIALLARRVPMQGPRQGFAATLPHSLLSSGVGLARWVRGGTKRRRDFRSSPLAAPHIRPMAAPPPPPPSLHAPTGRGSTLPTRSQMRMRGRCNFSDTT